MSLNLWSVLFFIAQIGGGILLALATLDKLDGESNFFNKIASILAPFQTIIGAILIVLGILRLGHNVIYSLISLAGGLLLLTHVLGKIPALGETLKKLSAKLMPFKAIVGIALLIISLLAIFK